MRFALVNGSRCEAAPGLSGSCQQCVVLPWSPNVAIFVSTIGRTSASDTAIRGGKKKNGISPGKTVSLSNGKRTSISGRTTRSILPT